MMRLIDDDEVELLLHQARPVDRQPGRVERGDDPVELSPRLGSQVTELRVFVGDEREMELIQHLLPPLADEGRRREHQDAARQSAQELKVPFIDLNAMSKTFYEALGPEGSKAAFAEPAPGRLDNTHHDNYGSYELAKAVVLGLRAAHVPAAAYIVDDFAFDPAHPDPVAAFAVPPSPRRTAQRPLGDEGHK